MDWKRIGRLLVCLVLVACMLVNISPIRAQAVTPSWILVSLGMVVASSLIGIGISAGTEAQAQVFTNVVNNACDWLKNSTEHVVFDSLTNAAKVLVYSTGNSKLPYMVKQSLVEDLRGWVFDTRVVSSSHSCPSGTDLTFSELFDYCAAQPYAFISYEESTGYYWMGFSTVPFIIDGRTLVTIDGSKFMYLRTFGTGSALDTSDFKLTSNIYGNLTYSFFGTGTDESYSTSYDLTLGSIVSEDVAFAEGYSDWSANASVAADSSTGDDTPVVPVGLGKTQDETSGYSQAGVWAGTSTYVDTSTDTGTDTETGSGSTSISADASAILSGLDSQTTQLGTWLSDVIEGIRAIPEAIRQVLVDVFVPAEDYVSVKVEALRANFPFIDSVIATGEFIRDSVSGASGPPVIYVDLGLASSGNYGNQRVILTDFAWYAQYKSRVDTVISAALWAFFGWRVFLRLPGIISGESGYIGEVVAHKEKVDKIRSGPPTGKK